MRARRRLGNGEGDVHQREELIDCHAATAVAVADADAGNQDTRKHDIAEAGLEEWAELIEGDAKQTVSEIDDVFDARIAAGELDADQEPDDGGQPMGGGRSRRVGRGHRGCRPYRTTWPCGPGS